MWEFFKSDKVEAPMPEDDLQWLEEAFAWLVHEFGRESINNRKMLRPEEGDFPFPFEHTENDAYLLLDYIAVQMDINPSIFTLMFHENPKVLYSGGQGGTLFPESATEKENAGLYIEDEAEEKVIISLDLTQLEYTPNLIAIIAHELGHQKLLGENRIEENNEYLTDLVSVVFGLGIFNGNASNNYYANRENWGYAKLGYLPEQAWGYALALYAVLREEGDKPDWVEYLNTNLQKDFKKSMAYIMENNIRPWDTFSFN